MADKSAVDPTLVSGYEKKASAALAGFMDAIDEAAQALTQAIGKLEGTEDITKQAFLIKDEVLPAMEALRRPCDEAEAAVAQEYWPFPTYGDLLFGV